ncbi:beta-ketoacyl-[acyl-carrier-protein] synthase family protein [Streptacidiphilus jiangxiensis]|uniref:Act minimal PKS ketosynthase (KS/KS alpha) n=1 Tax=Streptacidiphilus jiangxiensis TaxID=235985 RepID=A0A1H7JM60_STRJI|nr:beta-ketoacyl-[acyl-carrier-protein] synthase family protein [Streptacidiphilus jiangxiensis]SEK75651.1 act minimal PKS ketosynthase (KS/KS alpha) [Streptacidiphilus jiangxiensis]
MNRQVAITGIGVVAPGGVGKKAFWDLLVSGRTATRTISFFDPAPFRSQMAAEVDFVPEEHGLTPREIRRLDRAAQFAVVSTRECLEDSGLLFAGVDPTRIGVSVGSAVGGTTALEREYLVLSDGGKEWEVDPRYISPHLYDAFVPSSLASEVGRAAGAEGPAAVVSTGCTSGIDAVGYARDLIAEGSADVMIAGAADTPISPIAVACFDAIKATSPRNDDPAHASRPFDRTRNGFVLGEGAAMFVLEDLEHARARGAHVYGLVAGYATRCNAYHMTGLKPDGREMAEAIRHAIAESGIAPEDVDYVNAHGSGTKQNDRHETAAFKATLGEHAYRVPVSSIKSVIGHSLGAIGSIEIAACALAMQNGMVPPTANLHEPDPECDLDYVPNEARAVDVDTVLTVGSGFGGFQSAMILTREGTDA